MTTRRQSPQRAYGVVVHRPALRTWSVAGLKRFFVRPGRIPLARGLRGSCARLGLDPLRLAATGGEDFELLFTVRPRGPGTADLARRLAVPVSEIGVVEAGRTARGAAADASGAGWRHF